MTGAASGIGRAIALELARGGATVAAIDVDEERLAETCSQAGPRLRARALDVADGGAVRDAVDGLVREEGSLDLAVHSAGIAMAGPLEAMTDADWRRVVDVNLWGVIHGTRAAYAHMCGQRSGQILNVASTAGLVPVPFQAAYSATKHGVVGLSLALRPEAARRGVKVSVVCPGLVDTNIYRAATNVGGYDLAAMVRGTGIPMASAEATARHILDAAASDPAVIAYPAHAQGLWCAQRLAPRLLARLLGWRALS